MQVVIGIQISMSGIMEQSSETPLWTTNAEGIKLTLDYAIPVRHSKIVSTIKSIII